VQALGRDWSRVPELTPEQWEQLVGGCFHKMGYSVTVTPRSGDHGVDLIARSKEGIGAVKLLGSVKRYKRDRRVPAKEVRELMGALEMDPSASKGLLITTSDFAPRVLSNPGIAGAVPTRLDLINGVELQRLMKELHRERALR
jgi:restriction system protein